MNNQAIIEAFNRISKRRNDAVAEYDRHLEEVEKSIPEIVYLNGQIANTSRNILLTALNKGVDIKSQVEEIKRANLHAQQRINTLLQSHGYPSDYLTIKYHCPNCNDTGYPKDSTNYCECVTRLANEISAEWVNQNTHLQLSSFDTFSFDYYDKNKFYTIDGIQISEYENIVEIFNDCKNYARDFNPHFPNILMIGSTGLGKTHLSLAMARVISESGYSVIYNSAMDLFSSIEREKFSKYQNEGIDTLDSVLSVDLLILDDLGVEYDNKFYKSVLYNIINTRIVRNLATIINTNLSIKALNDKYENRITSRLFNYQVMEFFGKDIRQRKDYFRKCFEPTRDRSMKSYASSHHINLKSDNATNSTTDNDGNL